ncbi:hypothetical protein D082_34240 [Synechocystis sp. PCC 6714]|nr:hypothetical protein D082_34240 [Synechocystis sp. PCC 6714]
MSGPFLGGTWATLSLEYFGKASRVDDSFLLTVKLVDGSNHIGHSYSHFK